MFTRFTIRAGLLVVFAGLAAAPANAGLRLPNGMRLANGVAINGVAINGIDLSGLSLDGVILPDAAE